MLILDRYILIRFAANFAILLAVLFLFASSIDLILNLDNFVDAARAAVGPDGSRMAFFVRFALYTVDFQAPRLFQFYAFLHGLLAVGAMGFTLAQMYRHKELVAVMASGVSLYRVAMPFVVAAALAAVVQMLNQEFVLPRVAPLLLREHDRIGRSGVEDFPVPLTPAADGTLLHAPRFDPQTNTLDRPTIIERNAEGVVVRRIVAGRAVWSERAQGWVLTDGRGLEIRQVADRTDGSLHPEALDVYRTDLTPHVLTVRHKRQFASMLSMRQLSEMIGSTAAADDRALVRHWYARLTTVPVSVLLMLIALPAYLLREPRNLLRQSIVCAGVTLPAAIGAAVGGMADLPGISPAVGVFLPAIILLPIALGRFASIRS